jgi:hypothetical protein
MLQQDGAALVEEALAAPAAADLLHATGVRAALVRAAADPTPERVEMLLRVVNIGLLAAAVADLPPPLVRTPAGPALRAVTSLDDEAAQVRVRPRVGPDAVLGIRPGVLLLKGDDAWYVAVDGGLEFEPEHEWLGVLRAIDGTRTAADVIAGTTDGASIVEQLVDLRLVEVG